MQLTRHAKNRARKAELRHSEAANLVREGNEIDRDRDGNRRFVGQVRGKTFVIGPSHHSIGLQVADLVVGSTLAAQRAPGDATRWYKQLLPRFARHPDTSQVEGVGLKVFPDKVRMEEPPPTKLFDV